MPERRVYYRARDAARLLAGLESPAGIFVPTRLQLELGEPIILAVSLPDSARAVELPAVVTGRRLPRGAQRLLASGLTVRVREPDHPMLTVLHEVAEGRVVDLNARIQAKQRVAVTSTFPSFEGLTQELRSLLEGGDAIFPVEAVVYPKDRVRLTVGTPAVPEVLTFELVVRGLAHHDGRRALRGRLLRPEDEAIVRGLLEDLDAPAALIRR